jgi:hypothetical protein
MLYKLYTKMYINLDVNWQHVNYVTGLKFYKLSKKAEFLIPSD